MTLNLIGYTALNLVFLVLTIGTLSWLGMQATYKEAEARLEARKPLSEQELIDRAISYKYAPSLMNER